MPEIGEITTGTKLGLTQRGRYIYLACQMCGKPRWVTVVRSKKPYFKNLCMVNGCQQRDRANNEHSKDTLYWDGISALKIGMKCSVVDLKRYGYKYRDDYRSMLIWYECPNCKKHYWREIGRKYRPLCEDCSMRDNGKVTVDVWKDIEYKNNRVKKIMRSNSKNHSIQEMNLKDILDNYFPNEYEHVGNGKIVIGGKSPDFYNALKKKAILMHGDYWHLWRKQKLENNPNLTREDIELRDKDQYAKYGFDVLVIWGSEVKYIGNTVMKIAEFNKIGSVK